MAYFYMQLPEGSVPADLFDHPQDIVAIRLVTKKPGQRKVERTISPHVSASCCPEPGAGHVCSSHIRFYEINKPLEQIYVEMQEAIREVLGLRMGFAGVADFLALSDEIPTETNKKSWSPLVVAVLGRMLALISSTQSQDPKIAGGKKGN